MTYHSLNDSLWTLYERPFSEGIRSGRFSADLIRPATPPHQSTEQRVHPRYVRVSLEPELEETSSNSRRSSSRTVANAPGNGLSPREGRRSTGRTIHSRTFQVFLVPHIYISPSYNVVSRYKASPEDQTIYGMLTFIPAVTFLCAQHPDD